jgi:hypothetical protein
MTPAAAAAFTAAAVVGLMTTLLVSSVPSMSKNSTLGTFGLLRLPPPSDRRKRSPRPFDQLDVETLTETQTETLTETLMVTIMKPKPKCRHTSGAASPYEDVPPPQ